MVRYVVELPAHQRSQTLGGPLGLVMKCLILSPSKKQMAPARGWAPPLSGKWGSAVLGLT